MHKIRTIDVWDTLLRRDCHPECIKLATAHHLLFGWHDDIKPWLRDVWILYKARLDAEYKLADHAKSSGIDDEYEISQVIATWTSNVFNKDIPKDLVYLLMEFELSLEATRSFVDPDIINFLDSHQAEKTLFLSDFYMSGDLLRRLLALKHLDTLVSDGLSSCDIGLNKRSGKIFQYIHTRFSISPQDHLHIGDNEWSDLSSPRSLGVSAIHYQPESSHADRLLRNHLFSSREVLFHHIRSECDDLFENASRGLSEKQAAAMSLGIQAAPLFIGFALSIAEQTLLQKLDSLYFLTREGEFFQKVFCAIFPHRRFYGHNLPSADILEVSRFSTFTPSLREISIQEMSRIWSLFKVQSISGLFITLGLDIEKFNKLLDSLNLKSTDVVIDPKNSSELRRLFETPEFLNAVKNSLESQSFLLKKYLKQSGINNSHRVGIVDIGWRGTIQDNISLLVPNVHFHGMYFGLRRFINAQHLNTSKKAYLVDENDSGEMDLFFTNYAAFELLCNSPYGSVIGYSTEGEYVKAQRRIDHEENATHVDFVEPFQEGVLIAAKHWQSYLERYVVTSDELHKFALNIWDTFRKTPHQCLVDAYLHTPQQDIFGYGENLMRNQYPSLTTIFLSPIIPSRRRVLIDFIRRVQWTEAIEKADDIGWLHHKVLCLAFRSAHLVKRTILKAGLARRS